MDRHTQQNSKVVTEDSFVTEWDMWYNELHDHNCGLTLKVDRVLESTSSEFQTIDVIHNRVFGKLLVLYGSLMVCDNDHNAYNEMIAHVPLFSHPSPKNVLVIGGGDCGTITEVMKHPEVESGTMCEIDSKVVDVAKRHFPLLTEGLSDPRARLLFQDGKEFVADTTEKFDVIILDLSDPVGPALDLFQRRFHESVSGRLSEDGILVAQAESPYFNRKALKAMYRNLSDIFPLVRVFTCFMPIYPSGYWGFIYCSKKYDPLEDFDEERYDRLAPKTRYYNKETHRAAFALPQFLKDLLA
jgi:spermidine synthase